MKISSTNEVDENELLRQAVKNVKERVSDFENDVCQLKEDNVKLVETSQEKETENQALQETNMRLSMTWGEKDFQYVGMKEKAFACEQRLKDREQGQTGEFSQLFNAVTSLQGKTVLFQQERHEVTELERSRTCGLELEDARDREAVVAEQKAAKLRTKVTALEEKLLSSARAMKKVSQKAALQVESLKDQLDAVTKQKEETVSQLATSQKQGKQYAQALADSKVVLAE
ncbi:Thyroid Receptor-Interacting Protein 11 [Manis pentadactyla]|nr:Thyroid Receptor-Interacting Protein 11 [Manis pentadactyla]